ncbi:MAG: protein translocase subunit SecD [Galactobacter sp.]
MASTAPIRHARSSLLWLGIINVVLFAVLVLGVTLGKTGFAPKLALDLEGGTEMILTPQLTDGSDKAIPQEELNQAVSIIRERVGGAGVSESEVSTQNGRNIVISMPGVPSDKTRNLITSSAQMQFRPVLTAMQTMEPIPEDQRTPEDELPDPSEKPKDAYDPNWITADLQKQYEAWDCAAEAQKTPRTQFEDDAAAIGCEPGTGSRYIMGPVEVPGQDIKTASSGQATNAQGYNTGQWAVNLEFNKAGQKKFKAVTQKLTPYPEGDPRKQFAIVLDGAVISAPNSNAIITDGKAQITGSFTQESSKALAEQLKYGALPMSFELQSETQVSATLGTAQLKLGVIAGLIGLALVAAYSFFQYRLLGFVTIASLAIAGLLTYLAIVLLGWSANYRLSLAGVAGIIVSIGLTADSFIVYFERIRDELRDGRKLPVAVANGWQRARRTIMASKAVNLLAAVVLYFVAVGNVKGFAFTLGLTAVADLIVVFLFTHPTLVLLAKTKFFGEGHRASGLDPTLLGAQPLYLGAGRIRTPQSAASAASADSAESAKSPASSGTRNKPKARGAVKEAERRMTIAERKRAEELSRRGDPGAGKSNETDKNEEA